MIKDEMTKKVVYKIRPNKSILHKYDIKSIYATTLILKLLLYTMLIWNNHKNCRNITTYVLSHGN